MKYVLKSIWFCVAVSLLSPITTQAELTGEVIFLHPKSKLRELWICDIENTRGARQIFEYTRDIQELAVQNGGPYIVFVSETEEAFFAFDAYLINRNEFPLNAHNFTRQRFDTIWDIDISDNGDVVFTNYITGRLPDIKYGVYLIRRAELETRFPNAELIFEKEAYEVTWAPDGIHIAFEVLGGGIYLYNTVHRGGASVIDRHAHNPAFSPDGKHLALVHNILGKGAAISIISLPQIRRRLKTFAIDADVSLIDFKWTPDGKAIVYTVYGPDRLYHNYVAPLAGGPHEEILKIGDAGAPMFDWANVAYAVEPTNRLTTLWGKLKQQNGK